MGYTWEFGMIKVVEDSEGESGLLVEIMYDDEGRMCSYTKSDLITIKELEMAYRDVQSQDGKLISYFYDNGSFTPDLEWTSNNNHGQRKSDMPLEYVPDHQTDINQLTLVMTQCLTHPLLCAKYEVTEGKVEILEEKDISSLSLKCVRHTLELSEGAKVRFVRSDRFGVKEEREYVCRDGKIYYAVL